MYQPTRFELAIYTACVLGIGCMLASVHHELHADTEAAAVTKATEAKTDPTPPVNPLRERCHQIVAALRGQRVTDEQLDACYLQPYWHLVDEETQRRLKAPEAVFLAAVAQWVEDRANQGTGLAQIKERQRLLAPGSDK